MLFIGVLRGFGFGFGFGFSSVVGARRARVMRRAAAAWQGARERARAREGARAQAGGVCIHERARRRRFERGVVCCLVWWVEGVRAAGVEPAAALGRR